jgi:hypothetical protein
LEAQARKLKHKWIRRFEVDKEATGDNWSVCKRCGVVKDDSNKDNPCREAKKSKA